MSAAYTSYDIQWRRTQPDGMPARHPMRYVPPRTQLYTSPTGMPLFTVVTHGGPSEGIFTLIDAAPGMRDRIDDKTRRENRLLDEALVLLRAARSEAMTRELHDRIAAFLEAEEMG